MEINELYEKIRKYNELRYGNVKFPDEEEKEINKFMEFLNQNENEIKNQCWEKIIKNKNEDVFRLFSYDEVNEYNLDKCYIGEENIIGKRNAIINYFEKQLKEADKIIEDTEERQIYKDMINETIEELKNSKEDLLVMQVHPMDSQYHIIDTNDQMYEFISMAGDLEELNEISKEAKEQDDKLAKMLVHDETLNTINYFRIDLKDNSSCYVSLPEDIESIAREDVVNEAISDGVLTEGEQDNIAEISAIAKSEYMCMKNHARNYPCTSYKDLLNRILADCNVGINDRELVNRIDENTEKLDQRNVINSMEVKDIKLYILGLGDETFYVTKNANEAFNKAQISENIAKEKSEEESEEDEF